jgi:uncharacterized protein
MMTMPAEVALTDLPGEMLRVRVARAQLYLIYANAASAPGPEQAAVRDHLAYLYQLETEGRLFGYGSLEPATSSSALELAYVAAGSREEAENIAARDPFHVAGVRTNAVRAHTMNEGVACYVGRAMAKRALEVEVPFSPDIASVSLSYEDLVARASSSELYLVDLVPTDKVRPAEDMATMDAHFVWLRENEMAARLLSCGPVEPAGPLAPGIWGGGLGVLATNREEAQRIADSEPSGREGYRALSIRRWTLQYGLAAPIAQALTTLNGLPR